jgi:hypothetical protein
VSPASVRAASTNGSRPVKERPGRAAGAGASRIFVVFVDDDDGYLRWLSRHPDSLVLNCPLRSAPRSLVIHRASCPSIAATAPPGTRRTRRTKDTMKVCATWPQDLDAWVRSRAVGIPTFCQRCHR